MFHKGLFLTQSIILYTIGIKIYTRLSQEDNISFPVAVTTCLVVCIPVVAISAEIFYRLVDYPSQVLARVVFDWIRE